MTAVRNLCALLLLGLGVAVTGFKDTSSAASAFSLYSVRGTYRIAYSGLILSSGLPESGLGLFVADGAGHISGTEVFNSGGTVCPDVVVTATYTVSEAGTGTLSADFTSPTPGCSGHFDSSLLVLRGGDLVRAVATAPGFVTISEEWRRE